jgi:VanZ family protein
MAKASKWLALLALGGVSLGLLHAGFAPYDFGGQNAVLWSETGSGLVFAGGLAFSDGPLYWKPAEQPRELSVEAWVVPRAPWVGSRTVLGLVDEDRVAPFEVTLAEDRVALRYRVRDGAAGSESRAVSFEQRFEAGRLVHLAVTSGAHGTRLYVDGSAPDALRLRQPLLPAGMGFGARLVLGNSAGGESPWSGEFRGLAVFDRTLDESEIREHERRVLEKGVRDLAGDGQLRALYAFDEASGRRVQNLVRSESPIQIPRRFHALRWGVLELPAGAYPWSRRALADMLLNFLGFVPLGALVAYVRRAFYQRPPRRAFGDACVAVALLSLVIELGQALLPSRHSSALDLLLNAVGGALGAALLWLLQRAAARSATAD